MPRMRLTLFLWLLAAGSLAWAGDSMSVCFNYGCAVEATVTIPDLQLSAFLDTLALAQDADDERGLLMVVVGRFYALAGRQTPIHNDRGGNRADEGVDGRMDCIDHSTTTTRFLRLLDRHGGLRFHRVLDPVRRVRFIIAEHYSAAIEEKADPEQRFVVDSWFVDNGQPPVILRLEDWMEGEGPDV